MENNKDLIDEKLKLGRVLIQWLSHELASPLATIGLMSSFLSKRLKQVEWGNQPTLKEKDIAKLMSTPGLITDYIKHINTYMRMIEYHYEEIDAKYYPLSSLSAVACINNALKEYPFLNDQKRYIHWNEESDFTFLGNETLMQYTLLSLLDNALLAVKKAGDGKITISLQSNNSSRMICFNNAGKAVANEHKDSLFEPFHSSYSNHVGMGLFFCKNAMRAMEGDIVCQPRPDNTTFKLKLNCG